MAMDLEVYKRWVEGKTIVSCGFFDASTICLALESDEEVARVDGYSSSYVVHYLSGSDKSSFGLPLRGSGSYSLACSESPRQVLAVSQGLAVFRHDEDGGSPEEPINWDLLRHCSRVRSIGGSVYAVGVGRTVLRRQRPDQWECISRAIAVDLNAEDAPRRTGFHDIVESPDGLIVLGRRGQVWRYREARWEPVDVGTNASLFCACSAADGWTYIGGMGRLVLRGRGDHWEEVHSESVNTRIRQIVEFDGTLFAVDGNGGRLLTISERGLQPYEADGYAFPYASCFSLAVGYGQLLVAGIGAASIFDGRTWATVFESSEIEDYLLANDLARRSKSVLEGLADGLDNLDAADD